MERSLTSKNLNNAIAKFDWQKIFSNINVYTQVKLFNESFTNIFMKDKSEFYKQYIKNGRKEGDYDKLLNMTTNITAEILNCKKNYFDNFAEKLCDLKLNRMPYWGILKSFTNWKKKIQLYLLFS